MHPKLVKKSSLPWPGRLVGDRQLEAILAMVQSEYLWDPDFTTCVHSGTKSLLLALQKRPRTRTHEHSYRSLRTACKMLCAAFAFVLCLCGS